MKDMLKKNKATLLDHSLLTGNLNEADLKDFFKGSSDITFYSRNDFNRVTAFYCSGMVDTAQYNEYYNRIYAYIVGNNSNDLKEDIPPIIEIYSTTEMMEKAFSGFLIFFTSGNTYFEAIDISKVPQRSPEESKTELSIKGPRDGFTEELNVNISLIRKRMKTEELHNESFEIGQLSKTKIALLYLDHKINIDTLKEIRERIEHIQTESVVSSGQLEQWLSDRTFSIFPHLDYITRPDFAVECLLRGKFVVVVDGSPSVLIGPTNLFGLVKSPEDVHFPYYITGIQRMIRIIGLLIAIFAPGFYVAITNVNVDQLPFSLLATIVVSRQGLPFSLPLEAFFVLLLFELLKEAGVRMPTAVGQTVSIVGGLIIGDAAIRAGLTSPTLLVVIAVSAVATFTLVNQSLSGTVMILRLYIMILGIFLGVYGAVLGLISVVIYLSSLESFKVAYLEPFVSLNYKEFLDGLLTNPLKSKNFTSSMLQQKRRR